MLPLTFLTLLSAIVSTPAWADDGDRFDMYDELKSQQDERWRLALEQAKIELGAGLIAPDELITRAREIMIEQWGTPEERAGLADRQKEKELHERVESWVGAANLTIWKRLAPQPGTCWTRTPEGGIIIRDLDGRVTVLQSDRLPVQVLPGDRATTLYSHALEAVRRQLLTDGQVCVPVPPPPPARPARPWWDVDIGSDLGL